MSLEINKMREVINLTSLAAQKISYLLEVVKKFSIVVTPRVTLAGSAFHSIQKVTKDDVTRIIPEIIIRSFLSSSLVICTTIYLPSLSL